MKEFFFFDIKYKNLNCIKIPHEGNEKLQPRWDDKIYFSANYKITKANKKSKQQQKGCKTDVFDIIRGTMK